MKPSFPIAELVPHAGDMRFVDAVDAFDAEGLVASYTVPAQGVFLRPDGTLPAWVGVEMIAQAIAAHAGVDCKLRGVPIPIGFLVAARRYSSSVDAFPAGAQLTIHVRHVATDGRGLGMWDGRIEADGVEVNARISVFEPPDVDAFMRQGDT